jgi:hypothetical protein
MGLFRRTRLIRKLPNPYQSSVDAGLVGCGIPSGISRHGADRGCGLTGAAAKAIKFTAGLDIRLPHPRLLVSPARGE